jgi:hypothetical protein
MAFPVNCVIIDTENRNDLGELKRYRITADVIADKKVMLVGINNETRGALPKRYIDFWGGEKEPYKLVKGKKDIAI